ncbi:hypothetical protein G6F45_014208 [Rhizopus arrhizus]|nr:hypothetical protein G6F45_014208 [Rhizopus arrhizus]
MVDLAVLDLSIGRVHLQAGEGVDQLFGVDLARGLQALGDGHQRCIAHHRAHFGRFVVALLVGVDEGVIGGGIDGVPGVAGDDPARRRVGTQRFQVFRFA